MPTTFQVSEKAAKTIGERITKTASVAENLQGLLGAPVEASGANAPVVIGTKLNGLISAVHTAFGKHFPLVLSPDDIWLALAQGFALHVEANAEALRKQFVQHEGQPTILHMNNYHRGDPNNPWPESFKFFSDEIEKHIGKKRDLLVADFSTTGVIEKAASEVVLMGAMKQYFKYREMTLCGIPEITLLGSTEDWKSIRRRVETFAEFDLGWWVEGLLPILDRFVLASQGKADPAFWDGIYKDGGGSGGPFVTGWINAFFPYIEDYKTKGYTRINQYATKAKLSEGYHGPNTASFPPGLAKVPFVWDYLGVEFNYEFLGGFVGAHQEETLAVRPAIGWAVREVPAAP